ncbi:LmbU family transcriptional regulator [Streptomyces sp. NPDC059578]|uniref:LmbU family transcriptional regulator n=1 Tax=Streptomyces sp. NPDC059578 TaxID=3346874 RepID=UPI0036818A73
MATDQLKGRSKESHRRSERVPAEIPATLLPGDASIAMERTRLRLPENLPLDEWCRIGDRILSISDSSAWWVGDWLAFGQQQYSDRYQRAMRETMLDYQTLRNYVWVAKKFAPPRRRVKLTFQHHMEVAGLPEEQQNHWLDFAERFKWSRNELRRQIKASTAPDEITPRTGEVELSLRLAENRVRRWEEAAQQSNKSLTDWISAVLDSAA